MTLTVAWPSAWRVGAMSLLAVVVTGANPVSALVVDLIGDGQPAWYYVVPDARAGVEVAVGPMKRAGTYEITLLATDTRGCQVTLTPRTFITVGPGGS